MPTLMRESDAAVVLRRETIGNKTSAGVFSRDLMESKDPRSTSPKLVFSPCITRDCRLTDMRCPCTFPPRTAGNQTMHRTPRKKQHAVNLGSDLVAEVMQQALRQPLAHVSLIASHRARGMSRISAQHNKRMLCTLDNGPQPTHQPPPPQARLSRFHGIHGLFGGFGSLQQNVEPLFRTLW